MAKSRSYKLLCPIARALDRIGDRWTLLIIRDLHAGPASFSELQRGLTGIAANLLTDRLVKLVEDGIARKAPARHGASVYELTELGKRTSGIIFELAMFGARFEPEGDIVSPGNLRTVTTTIGIAASRVATPEMNFDVAFTIDQEPMYLKVRGSSTEMVYGDCHYADIVFSTSYSALLALMEGELDPDEFAELHSKVEVLSSGKDGEFMKLMFGIVGLFRSE